MEKYDNMLCVVSDTHDDIESFQALVGFCNRYGIKNMVHAGDIVDTSILETIKKKYKGKALVTLGNHDRNRPCNKYAKYFKYDSDKIMICEYDGYARYDNKIMFSKKRPNGDGFLFRVYHGDSRPYRESIIQSTDQHDVFIHGHLHEIQYTDQLYAQPNKFLLNPGTFSFNTLPVGDQISFMVICLKGGTIHLILVVKLKML